MLKKIKPKISIVIPCYNMEKYIEQTLLSIINQDYKNFEIIIVDGLSIDKTLMIIKKYKKYIHKIISERDSGQYNAINKGMNHATGDILAWINADDIYFPWTFRHVGEFFLKHPKIEWISGMTALMDETGLLNGINRNIIAKPNSYIEKGWFREELYGFLQQEGMFWRKELWNNYGGLDEHYRLAADFELWTRFSKYSELVSFGLPLSSFRIRDNSRSKLQKEVYNSEVKKICLKLKSPSKLKQYLGKKNEFTNVIMRKLTLKKSKIYYYSLLNKSWMLSEKYTTMSPHSLTSILSLH